MRALALLLVLGCGGSGPDVFGKSWTQLTSVPGSPSSAGFAFDHQGRLITANLDGTYRFDLADRKWSYFTPAPGATSTTRINNDFAGVVSKVDDGYYRLADDDSWHKVADLAPGNTQYPTLAAGDTLYWLTIERVSQRYALWRRQGGVDVMLRSELNLVSLQVDNRGRPMLELVADQRGGSSFGYIGDDGNLTTTLYTCDPLNPDPWCEQPSGGVFAEDSGDVFFVGNNDLRGSKISRVLAGSTSPELVATFPVADGERMFNHSINFAWDAAGNGYATRTNNQFGAEVLFVLPAGESEFRKVIDTPGLVDVALVRQDGTVFAVNGGTGEKFFYLLE